MSSMSCIERFWAKVDVRGDDECWPWIGAVSDTGYGVFRVKSWQGIKAHRLSILLATTEPPLEGMDIMHSCDVRHCVNPRHLSWGTRMENVRDMIRKGRAPRVTHCKHGHPFSGDNVVYSKRQRRCVACSKKRGAEAYAKRKAQKENAA